MKFTIKNTIDTAVVASFIVSSIMSPLKLGKKVLFFVTGGSSITIGLKVAELLQEGQLENQLGNLTITVTDERYGPVNHVNSNWYQLMEKGFSISSAKLIPVLTVDDITITTKKWNTILSEEFKSADYKLGLFGIGSDGHIAGILPASAALRSQDLACTYDTPTFSRITMTLKAIEQLNEVIVFAQGKEKWPALENLEKDIDIAKQPAQIIKKVPLVTIFTDFDVRATR